MRRIRGIGIQVGDVKDFTPWQPEAVDAIQNAETGYLKCWNTFNEMLSTTEVLLRPLWIPN